MRETDSPQPSQRPAGRPLRRRTWSALVVACALALAGLRLLGIAGAAPGDGPVTFTGGLAVVEAEDFDAKVPRSSHDWVAGQSPTGSVAGALKAAPDTGTRLNKQIATTSPELGYRVRFPAAGAYTLWVRTYGVARGNTLHLGWDGQVTAQNVSVPAGAWSWTKVSLSVSSAGDHLVQVWMREDGLNIDRLLLATSAGYVPSGAGPAVTPRAGSVPADTTPPTLTGRQPASGATGVAPGTNVVATFSEAMAPASITAASFSLAPSAGGAAVAASIAPSAGDTVFTLDPAADLAPGTAYTATVTTGARDAAGNALAATQTWSFTTAAAPPPGDGPVVFANGLAVVEAEDFDGKVGRNQHDWLAGQSPSGSVGGALQAAPDTGLTIDANVASTSAELSYRVRFPAAGKYYLWFRVSAPDGGGNSLHSGLDGVVQEASDSISTSSLGAWAWVAGTLTGPGPAAVTVPSAGEHAVDVWMREDGLHLDRIVVTADAGFAPSGQGPAATPRDTSGDDVVAPTVAVVQPADGASGVGAGANAVATFSEPMNAATIGSASFTLAPAAGGAVVPASISASADGRTFTLDPNAALLPGTAYTASLSAAAMDAAGNGLVSRGWTFTTGPAPGDPSAPTLTGRTPGPGAAAVPADAAVVVEFSEAMSPSSVTSSSFRLVRAATGEAVPATIAASGGNTAFTLQPKGPLAGGVAYTATVTTAVRDAAGNPLAAPASWSFTTDTPTTAGGGGERGPVTFAGGLAAFEIEDFDARVARSSRDWVAGTSPTGSVGGSLQAAPDAGAAITTNVTTTSSELVYRVAFPAPGTYDVWVRGNPPDTAGNSVYVGLDGALGQSYLFDNAYGAWGWMGQLFSGVRATIAVPSAGEHTLHLWMREDGFHLDRVVLTADAAYTPTGSGPPATSRQGAGDAVAPVVVDRGPTPGAASAPQGSTVTVRFSEPMDPSTLTPATVTLAPAAGGAAVPATVTVSTDGRSASLDPSSDLAASTGYRVSVSTAARDLAGNPLAAAATWTFTTRAPVRYEPADGRIYSGVSTRGVDAELDGFLAVSSQPSVALHNRFNRRGDPEGFDVILGDLKRKGLTGMISWSLFEGNFYSPSTPGANHASIARGDLDGYILQRAADVRAYGDPLFLRLHWEMNHDFFPWAVYGPDGTVRPGNTHADFRASWRRAVILFRGGTRTAVNAALAAAGLPGLTTGDASVPATTNVAWAWVPGSDGAQAGDDIHAYWPGDGYVDWVGVDWYPQSTGDAGLHQARAAAPGGPNELYRRYSALAEAAGKPFVIGEWGVFGQDRPAWVSDMFAWLAERPMAKAQLYFNIDASDANSRLQDFPQSAAAFRAGIAGSRWIRDPGAVGGGA
jgi:hypothetical protein